jgi:ribosomal protein L11 methyltransferase
VPTHLVTALVSRDIATRLADVLMEGAHALDITATGAFEQAPPDWRFEAWMPAPPDEAEWARAVGDILGPDAEAIAFEHRAIEDADWVRMGLDDLPPVRVGRFVVHGAHDAHKVRPNEVALLVEAGAAFGTGHHGTTAGCLAAIERRARVALARGERRLSCLDVGTGTGVLALAFANALKRPAIAGDNDADAVRIARENARLNGAGTRLRVVLAAGTKHPAMRAGAPYDVVIANILAGPLASLAGDFARATKPGGTLILSGLLAWQTRWITAIHAAHGFRLERRDLLGDWATLTLRRR